MPTYTTNLPLPIGTRVRILCDNADSARVRLGQTGTITGYDLDGLVQRYVFLVDPQFRDGRSNTTLGPDGTWGISRHNLEPISTFEVISPPVKFRAGDKVAVIMENCQSANNRANHFCIVVSVDRVGNVYVTTPEGNNWSFASFNLKLLERAPVPKRDKKTFGDLRSLVELILEGAPQNYDEVYELVEYMAYYYSFKNEEYATTPAMLSYEAAEAAREAVINFLHKKTGAIYRKEYNDRFGLIHDEEANEVTVDGDSVYVTHSVYESECNTCYECNDSFFQYNMIDVGEESVCGSCYLACNYYQCRACDCYVREECEECGTRHDEGRTSLVHAHSANVLGVHEGFLMLDHEKLKSHPVKDNSAEIVRLVVERDRIAHIVNNNNRLPVREKQTLINKHRELCAKIDELASKKPTDYRLFFGLELEVYARKSVKTPMAQKACQKDLGKAAILKRDGSLGAIDEAGEGFEIVTVPATLEYHRKKLWTDFFRPDGAWSKVRSWKTEKTGLHIHFTKAALSPAQLAKFLVFMHEPCNSVFLTKLAGRNIDAGAQWCKQRKMKLGSRTGHQARNGEFLDHYTCANVSRSTNYKTVEVRIFRGNATYHGVMRALDFVAALIEFSGVTSTGKYVVKQPSKLRKKIDGESYKTEKTVLNVPGVDYRAFLHWFNLPDNRARFPDLWKQLIKTKYLETPHTFKVVTGPLEKDMLGKVVSGLQDVVTESEEENEALTA